jgi:hypothetical protein
MLTGLYRIGCKALAHVECCPILQVQCYTASAVASGRHHTDVEGSTGDVHYSQFTRAWVSASKSGSAARLAGVGCESTWPMELRRPRDTGRPERVKPRAPPALGRGASTQSVA